MSCLETNQDGLYSLRYKKRAMEKKRRKATIMKLIEDVKLRGLLIGQM